LTPAFGRYIGIDYSGAKTPTASLKELREYSCRRSKTTNWCFAGIYSVSREAQMQDSIGDTPEC